MRLTSALLAAMALLASSGTVASPSISISELEKIKKMRDASEYMAKRHVHYDRVDLSFSKFPINSELPDIKDRLTELSCDEYDEGCEAKDADGNNLYFWGANYEEDGKRKIDHILTIKTIDVPKFEGRAINALGIRNARQKANVMRNVQKFLPGLKIECDRRPSRRFGSVECGGTVDPGWFRIGFDDKGNLLNVRFDAYHFT